MRHRVALLPLLLLPACATVTDGRTQIIAITTDPPGAACVVDRADAVLGRHLDEVPSTPGTVLVEKSAAPLRITCAAPGAPTAQGLQRPGVDPYVWGNVLVGGMVGLAMDVSSGAADRYPPEVHLNLMPPAASRPSTPVSEMPSHRT